MIKPKIGICFDCGPTSKPTGLIAGRCQRHYWQGRQALNLQKKKDKIESEPVLLLEKTALGLWFKYHIEHNIWICENCKDKIDHYSEDLAYCAQAHILPKKTFISVKSNLDNHITMCSRGSRNNCHTAFDTSWERASRMPVFEIAKQRFLKFCHILPPDEISKLPEIFLNLIPKI